MFISAAQMQKDPVTTKTKTSPEKENGILLATDVAKAKRGKGVVHFVRIRIGSEVAKKAKFEPGMKVDLLIGRDGDEGKGMLVRVPPDHETGWILAGLRRTAAGEQPLQLRYTWHEKQPSIPEPALGTEVKASAKEGITFRFPEGTTFTELAVKTEVQPELMFRRRSTDRTHKKVA